MTTTYEPNASRTVSEPSAARPVSVDPSAAWPTSADPSAAWPTSADPSAAWSPAAVDQSPAPMPPPARPTARPAALSVAVFMTLVGGFLTLIDLAVDHFFLADMFVGNDTMEAVLPTFIIVRDVVDVLAVVATTALVLATLRRVNWARVLVGVACLGYAAANLGAAAVTGFTLTAALGAFSESGNPIPDRVLYLNVVSLVIDVAVLIMIIICSALFLTGASASYTRRTTASA